MSLAVAVLPPLHPAAAGALWLAMTAIPPRPLDPAKFCDPRRTARDEARAHVALRALETLWFNTGSLCNIACATCYIESSPRNERLAYLSRAELAAYLDEVSERRLPTRLIGFTGGEPFLNRDMVPMLAETLGRGFDVLVLTNAMRPMQRRLPQLLALHAQFGGALRFRVSLDHYTAAAHEAERGRGSFAKALGGLEWLVRNGFPVDVAGRLIWHETEPEMRAGFARLFADQGMPIDAHDPVRLMLFPNMDAARDVPEITEACWGILGRSPDSVMCASSRMVVKRQGAAAPVVLACTLLPYDPRFELGPTLADAEGPVALNHPHCASFCVLGGAACSRG